MTNEEKINLFKDWLKHKKAEETAKKKRNEVEAQLTTEYISQLTEKEKSKTIKEDNLGFSINLKKNVSFKLDQEKYKTIRLGIPENLRPEKIKFELNETGFQWLKENNQEVYLKVSDCVTETPGKTGITVAKI